jgi:predicted Zn-dependent protease
MRAGHQDRARQALAEIVSRDPHGARAEAALMDLARLALADGNPGDAQRYLSRLPDRLDDQALAEPADHLRCSTALRLGDIAAARLCLTNFRRRHPGSLHDAETLALLAAHAGDCHSARPLLEEYLRLYPRGPFGVDARARLAACCGSCE